MKTDRKFTLIELLICIAVIAILVAMLMPMLSRVRYKAKLVVCMNNLHQIGLSVTTYAGDNKGFYPERKGVRDRAHGFPYWVYGSNYDDRPRLPIEIQCPMVPFLDLSKNCKAGLSSYTYFAGWTFIDGSTTGKSFRKTTDVLTFKSDSFDILASDAYAQIGGYPYLAIHSRGQGYLLYRDGARQEARSQYRSDVGFFGVEMNFVRKDGSVFMVRNLDLFKGSDYNGLKMVPVKYNMRISQRHTILPTVDYSN